ncbi:SET domain-containing protein [Favolaschia claudopus]|uniref:SET domain-containing protein n=1 Tax=Favolaschia claudopus TaxID=2862362 RepID=A0AAW0C2C9_9AGAR
MKRGFLNNKRNDTRVPENKAPIQRISVTDNAIPNSPALAGCSQQNADREQLQFRFSSVCRLYSRDPAIVVGDHRLPSGSESSFLYLPTENPTMVFVAPLDMVQAVAEWDTIKHPCAPLQNPPFIVRSSGSKGLGMFASRAITRGELIMRERPIYVAHPSLSILPDQKHSFFISALAGLSPASRNALMLLRNAQPETPDVGMVRGILLTNALAAKITHLPNAPLFPSVFPTICRANHDCTPNAHYVFCAETFCGQLFALHNMAQGEEITIGYTELAATKATRRESLETKYHFVCECSTCCLPPERAAESDRRREVIAGYLASMKKGEQFPTGASLAQVKNMMRWADEEGLVEVASILGISAWRLARSSDDLLEQVKMMVVVINYARVLEGKESVTFQTLAKRMDLSTEELGGVLDSSTPETLDYAYLAQRLAPTMAKSSR